MHIHTKDPLHSHRDLIPTYVGCRHIQADNKSESLDVLTREFPSGELHVVIGTDLVRAQVPELGTWPGRVTLTGLFPRWKILDPCVPVSALAVAPGTRHTDG